MAAAAVRAPSQQKVVRHDPASSIDSKQLKSLQYLLTGASYLSVLEGSTTNKEGLRDRCLKTYHGYDEDHLGLVHAFLEGDGRFEVLWSGDIFQTGFGHLTGLRKHDVMHVITKATLRGNHLLSGRQIVEKAKAVMLDAKKYLAYWMEFLINGSMPSGMNEENALQHVLRRAQEESSSEIVEENESGGEIISPCSNFIQTSFRPP